MAVALVLDFVELSMSSSSSIITFFFFNLSCCSTLISSEVLVKVVSNSLILDGRICVE